jgi:GNAT superfamily N-acetyltransferase
MNSLTTKSFSLLSDHMAVYQFMLDAYSPDYRNGLPAPFWEYALVSSWMDKSYLHRCRMWKDRETIVGFCFHENPVTDVYFTLRPGYETLAPEMVAYAAEHMPRLEGRHQLVLMGKQAELIEAAKNLGYSQVGGYHDQIYDCAKPLEYPLPEGFRFTEPGGVDVAKATECCWKGFDHEAQEGPWDGQYEDAYELVNAPHATPEHHIAVMNQAGEYVCYAGMWWVPENKLAYLEPLCTVPAYRRKGLAAATLSELYRRLRPLGAEQLTGGGNPFYQKIGFGPGVQWTYWQK